MLKGVFGHLAFDDAKGLGRPGKPVTRWPGRFGVSHAAKGAADSDRASLPHLCRGVVRVDVYPPFVGVAQWIAFRKLRMLHIDLQCLRL